MSARRALSALIPEIDAWRREGRAGDGEGAMKEWHHFVVFDRAWTLLFNLNLDGPDGGRCIVVLQRDGWRAEVLRCASPAIRRGRLDADFGDAGMRWRDGRYEVWARRPHLALDVALTPSSVPSLSHDISLGADARLSWCLVPQLLASGHVAWDGVTERFVDRAAYHDHNWGRFVWGGDFAWEWGCAVSEGGGARWTVILARMTDATRSRTTATSVFLIRDGRCLRYFRDAEAEFACSLDDAPPCIARAPGAAALLVPDHDQDVPGTLSVRARRGDDVVDITLRSELRGQLLVPSERAVTRVVRVNEAHGRAQVRGRCADLRVEFEGPALLEVVRG
ncbi:MAG: hypothetical protein U0325_21410 [Polyangiales bacterium]